MLTDQLLGQLERCKRLAEDMWFDSIRQHQIQGGEMHKVQGNIGEAAAILHFTKLGYIVSKPLFENTPYDLVVDDGCSLLKVQVKTTGNRKRATNFCVELRTKGGNTSWNGVVKVVTKATCDLLFVYCSDGSQYLIPVEEIDGQVSVTLGRKYASFMV